MHVETLQDLMEELEIAKKDDNNEPNEIQVKCRTLSNGYQLILRGSNTQLIYIPPED